MFNRTAVSRFDLRRSGVALAAALLLGAAAPAWADATQAQCNAKWGESSADDSCSNEQITPTGDNCRITASCTTTYGGNVSDSITVHLDQVSGLRNCDGDLTLGHC